MKSCSCPAVCPGSLGDRLTPSDLPDSFGTAEAPHAQTLSLEDNERALIQEALQRAGGNKSAAARLLGITRRRLCSLLERQGRS